MLKLAPKLCAIMLAGVCGLMAKGGPASASDYPTRPIRVIIAVTPGGIADIFMRALGERLAASLKQPFIMENRPGGTFNIATRNCAEAAPDGYTICLLPGEPLTYNQFLFKNPGFNAEKDFASITNLFFITQVLAVNTARRSAQAPGVPTVAEATNIPDYDYPPEIGVMAPAQTAPAIINRLADGIAKAVKHPETQQRFTTLGIDGVGNTPAEYAAQIRVDIKKYAAAVKAAGIKLD